MDHSRFTLGRAVPGLMLFCAFFGKLYMDRHELSGHRPSPRVTRSSAEFQAHSLLRNHFGFRNALADLLWIQLLQSATHQPLAHDEVSWEYAMLNGITALDPKFSKSYPFGCAFLSVFRRDHLGAQLFLEKWTKYEPTNWRSHYMLGYHYFFEQHKYDLASKSILRAAHLAGAPSWLNALGVRLMSESGAYFSALHVALDLYPAISDTEGKTRLKKRIRSLRYSLLRSAWAEALKKYNKESKRRPASLQDLLPLARVELGELSSSLAQLSIPEELEDTFKERFQFHLDPTGQQIELVSDFDRKELLELEETGIHHRK